MNTWEIKFKVKGVNSPTIEHIKANNPSNVKKIIESKYKGQKITFSYCKKID